MDLGQSGGRGWPATEHGEFIDALGLPVDATAMTLEQLDQLIAYHDALCTRYDEALAGLNAVRDQIDAAVRESGREILGSLEGSKAASLRDAWNQAFSEYNRCGYEVEAIGAYVERLNDEDYLRSDDEEGE